MLVFSGSSNKSLAKRLAIKLKVKLGKLELSSFANNELRIRVNEEKIGNKAIIVQSLSEPVNHHLIELLLINDALKRLGVKEITAVISYIGYSKQDKVFRKGEPLSIEVIAKILDTGGFKKIILFDLHNPNSIELFKTSIVNLLVRSLFLKYFKTDKNTMVIAPDAGAVKLSNSFAKELGVGVAYINKQRDLETGEITIDGINRIVTGKNAVMIDDMLATGGTLVETAKFLKKQGVQSIKVGVTHHLYVKGAQEKIDQSKIDRLIVTDTIEQKRKSKKLKVISVVELIAKEISG